jgi:hypothetical protein
MPPRLPGGGSVPVLPQPVGAERVSGPATLVPPKGGRISSTPDLVNLLTKFVREIRSGEIASASDVAKRIRISTEQSYWQKFNIPANFLKHADRDHAEAISTEKMDNQQLLLMASAALLK